MSKRSVILPIILSVVTLAGCASNTASQFSCPVPNTGMCQSVHTVDRMIDRGELGPTVRKTSTKHTSTIATDRWGNATTPYASTLNPGQPLRAQDVVMGVWIAPYEDNTGVYHDASTVYAVMTPSHWATHPVKTVKEH